MTEKDLLTKLAVENAEGMAEAFASLTEPERKELHRTLVDFEKKAIQMDHYPKSDKALHTDYLWLAPHFGDENIFYAWQNRVEHNLNLARLALGDVSGARKVGMDDFLERDTPAMVKVLADRRPAWLDDWIEYLLSPRHEASAQWEPLQELIRRGVCRRPRGGLHDELGKLLERFRRGRRKNPSNPEEPYLLSDYLRENPDVLDDIYPFLSQGAEALIEDFKPWSVDEAEGLESAFHAMRRTLCPDPIAAA